MSLSGRNQVWQMLWAKSRGDFGFSTLATWVIVTNPTQQEFADQMEDCIDLNNYLMRLVLDA